MSRFKALHLEQGKEKFNLGYVELEIQKTVGNPNWEITIRAEYILGVYKAYGNNSSSFKLHAEWTSKSHGVTNLESISGDFWIAEIDLNKKPSPNSGKKCYTLYGFCPNLNVSGVPNNERVKVQFD